VASVVLVLLHCSIVLIRSMVIIVHKEGIFSSNLMSSLNFKCSYHSSDDS
jgi:hypothetical protein